MFGISGGVSEFSSFHVLDQLLLPYSQSVDPRTDPMIKFDAAWMDRAELVIVRTTRGAPVERTLRIENFQVGEQ